MIVAESFYLFPVFILSLFASSTNAWFFSSVEVAKDEALTEENGQVANDVVDKAKFELTMTDDKFLKQALQDNNLSPLDICHHQVIYNIKTTCHGMSEVQLNKAAVQLLNCQLQAENRNTFPCSDDMELSECTQAMDATTWNGYQIVANRARAICYSARQQQFRIKTEVTVNKLLSSASGQIKVMKDLENGQKEVAKVTDDTLKKMEKGQEEMVEKQQRLKSEQENVYNSVVDTLEELTKEKAMIAAGHSQVANATESIRKQLEETMQKMSKQESSQQAAHEAILQDLGNIREKAREVFRKMDESSHDMLKFQSNAVSNYKQTMSNLEKVTQTVDRLATTMTDMKNTFNDKLMWIQDLVGGTGDKVAILWILTLHAGYLVLAAISCSILGTPPLTRWMLFMLVSINALSEVRQQQSLDFAAMTLTIAVVVLANWLFGNIVTRPKRVNSRDQKLNEISSMLEQLMATKTSKSSLDNSKMEYSSYVQRMRPRHRSTDRSMSRCSTPVKQSNSSKPRGPNGRGTGISDETEWSNLSLADTSRLSIAAPDDVTISPSSTNKSVLNNSSATTINVSSRSKPLCSGITVAGQQCRSVAGSGGQYCHRHDPVRQQQRNA